MSEEIDAKGVNVDEFFDGADEGTGSDVAQSHAEVEEVGEELTEKAAEETPNVSITDLINDSNVEEPEDKEHAEGFVPVDKHLKLRERAQAAEARVKELESQTTHTDAENSGLEIDDDDYLTGKDMKSIAAQIEAKADRKAEARYKASNAKDLVKARTTKALADQDLMIEEGPSDYLDVIEAMTNIQLSPAAIAKIKNADNAAEKAYEIGCQVLNRQPAQKTTPNTPRNVNKNKNNAEQSAEDIFDEVYNS
jgi:hypothetical protein